VIRVAFLIRSIGVGGAERQLLTLVRGLEKRMFDVSVVTFYDEGAFACELRAINGVRLISLEKKGRWDVLPFTLRLLTCFRELKPAIIHGYMGSANILSLLAGKAIGSRVVWGVRSSSIDFEHYDWLPRAIFKVECALARFCDLIIANSNAGADFHAAHGFPKSRMRVVPNGIDTKALIRDTKAGSLLRNAWGIRDDQPLIGLVGRLDPMKDHPTFLRAAVEILRRRPEVRFVCVGDGLEAYKRELRSMASRLGLESAILWVGRQDQMCAVYSALDLLCSCSIFGEGFPNVVGEAMACGTPCVVTDVGDSAEVVGDTGLVISPRRPEQVAGACLALLDRLDCERKEMSTAARQRIVERFTVERLVQTTQDLLLELCPAV